MELSPDPFTTWADAAELLQPGSNATGAGSPQRRLHQLNTTNSSTTTTGEVPVQGRVTVRETATPMSNDGVPVPAGPEGVCTCMCT